ncbi:speckle-type POZ protein B [Caerostris extrusa]|uniref:Speckle-type POZ protein B n=1 Tax=Caerostris extrusa TaxID=172846 RepID=A0AAV4QDC6_CAEEX|nr:speckle-type POZ protein B [Caerostris extrusa]
MERSDKALFTFVWKLINFSFYSEPNTLTSPAFVVKALEETTWALHLCPRDKSESESEVTYYLQRMDDAGPESIAVDYELSLVNGRGYTMKSAMFRNYSFKRKCRDGCAAHALRDEILVEKKSSYLPDDTLTVHCKIWKLEEEAKVVGKCIAQTLIGIEHANIIWTVENFSQLEVSQMIPVPISWASRKQPLFLVNMYKSDDRIIFNSYSMVAAISKCATSKCICWTPP